MSITIHARKNQFPHVVFIWTVASVILCWTLVNIRNIGIPLFGMVSYIFNPIGLAFALYKAVASFCNYWYILFNKKCRLVINDEGMSNFLTIHSFGTVSWDEVESFEMKTFFGIKVLLIRLKNPIDFIKRQKSWKQKLAQKNLKDFGTPAFISEKQIEYDITELMYEFRFRQDKALRTTFATKITTD